MSVTTKSTWNVIHSQKGGGDAVIDVAGGAERIRDRREDPFAALEEKNGPRRAGTVTPGLSPALLSKIERGRLFPTLPTLLRIALVFSVDLDFFFAGAREQPLVAVVRKEQRVSLPDRPGARDVAYHFASLDYPATERRFNSYYAEFLSVAPDKLRPHAHPGVEFIYALAGKLSVHINGEEHAIERRRLDIFRFDCAARLQAQRRAHLQRHRRHVAVGTRLQYCNSHSTEDSHERNGQAI